MYKRGTRLQRPESMLEGKILGGKEIGERLTYSMSTVLIIDKNIFY